MSIVTWIRDKIFSGQVSMTAVDSNTFWSLAASVYVRELAFESAKNIVSKAISKCEFRTYQNRKEMQGELYYLWNFSPNRNQGSSVFLNKLISKLYDENECLVVQTNSGQMLVADSFQKEVFALRDYKFTNVTVDDYTFDQPFYMADVLYFKLNTNDVRKLLNGLHESYGKLAEYAQKAYVKSRGQKGILSISSSAQGKKDFEATLEKMMNERFKKYFESDNAVMPLTDGFGYLENDRKTYNSDSTRDIRAQIDDIFVFTARAFGIAPALILGDLADTDKAINATLTLCIDPLCDMIEEEINRKTYGKTEYLKGNYLTIDTKTIKHIDLMTVSGMIDKLISSGGFCINDVRKACNEEIIDEPWAYAHWMTKNYSPVAEVLAALSEAGDVSG